MTGCSAVHLSLSKCVELPVRCLLFAQIRIEQAYEVVMTKFLSPRDERAVTRDLVMLNRLR